MKSFGVDIEDSSDLVIGIEALPAWKRLQEVSTTSPKRHQEVSTTSPMVTPTSKQEAHSPRVPLQNQTCNSDEWARNQQRPYQDTLEGLSSVGLLLQGPPRGQKRKANKDDLCAMEERKRYLRKRLLQAYPQLRENLQMLCSKEAFNQQITKDIADGLYKKINRQGNFPSTLAREADMSTPIGDGSEILVSSSLHPTSPSLVYHQDLPLAKKNTGLGVSPELISDIADMVVEDLNQFGICVVDDFLGSLQADKVFDDVNVLYNKGVFQDGAVVSQTNEALDSKKFRGDKITWVGKSENTCYNTQQLVSTLDAIISTANKHPKAGKINDYNITSRTRAMVACYPGNGARYVKHVDNPNGDGRCITAIYYLNKNWQKENGGVLRLYPEDSLHKVAEIEPLFDRMVFFWSDKRNPHEVLPVKITRFAITVWYLDQDEREDYISKMDREERENCISKRIGRE